MSYKMDGESIAPEVFTFAGPSVPPQRKTKPLKGKKNKKKGGAQSAGADPAQSSQDAQPSQPPAQSIAPSNPPQDNFWEKPPAFCDISIKDALAPIKRNGVEIESPFTPEQVLRAAAAEVEHFNTDGMGKGRGVENYGWYLGKEDDDRRRKAAERAKYAGKPTGKGKVQGKLVNLSQLRLAATGMLPNPGAGPSRANAPTNSSRGGKRGGGYIARPSQKFVPLDSASDTGSEYHDADCECGCVSATDSEDDRPPVVAVPTRSSQKRPMATSSDSESYVPKINNKGKGVARVAESDSSTPRSPPAPPRESEDEYYGSDCGCEGEYCDSDCDFYPSDFYASDVYFEVESPATPQKAGPSSAHSSRSSSPISFRSTPSRSTTSLAGIETADVAALPEARERPSRTTSRAVPAFEYLDLPSRSKATPAASAKSSRLPTEGSRHSPPAKRRRPTTSLSPPRPSRSQRERRSEVMTLGELALQERANEPPMSFHRSPPPAERRAIRAETLASSAAAADAERLRRERMVEMERQRQFLQTLVADLPRMQQETAAIVAASFTSAPPNPYLPSPPDTPTPPFPGSTYPIDESVLVLRRPSVPSDFEFEDATSDYDSETDPWTFIQQATARDIVRVERAGAEPCIEMLIRLQKSSRREALNLWRQKLRSRQAAKAAVPAHRTSLPSRPRTGPRANESAPQAEKRPVQPAAAAARPRPSRHDSAATHRDRALAMKLQLDAVLGSDPPFTGTTATSTNISSAISLSLQVEAELKAAAQQPNDKRTLEALASRHTAALSAMAASYSAQSREFEERAFREVRELALAAKKTGTFRPLVRAAPRAGASATAILERLNGTRANLSAEEQRERLGRRTQMASSSIGELKDAEGREVAMKRRAYEHADMSGGLPNLHAPNPSYTPPPHLRHPNATPFLRMTETGMRNLGYRTPEEIWREGWRGWSNLTREEEADERVREGERRRVWWKLGEAMGEDKGDGFGEECPLAWRTWVVPERQAGGEGRCRTAFGCLLCKEGHLASF